MARVLVIDDQPEVAQSIGSILEDGAHQVLYARPGAAVIDALGESYDILITDVVMPEINGWELITRVRRERPDARIIAISGGSDRIPVSGALNISRRLGADLVLAKPLGVDLLLAGVDALLKRAY